MADPTRPAPDAIIESAWGQWAHDRVAHVYANSTDRNAAIPAPFHGQLAFLQDVKRWTYYDQTSWATLPGTLYAAPTSSTADAVATGAGTVSGAAAGIAQAFPIPTARRLKVYGLAKLNGDAAGVLAAVLVYLNGAPWGQKCQWYINATGGPGQLWVPYMVADTVAVPAGGGTKTFDLRVQKVAGSGGNVATLLTGSTMFVEDNGPA